jgi:hypothetical protein
LAPPTPPGTPSPGALGHVVSLQLSSNTTSFGVGLSVSGPDGWQQVPIAYPLRTGLWAVSGGPEPRRARQPLRCAGPRPFGSPLEALVSNVAPSPPQCDAEGKAIDVMMLMPHASLLLHVTGPAWGFDAEWCLGVAGFTGWVPFCFVNRPWAMDPAFRVVHPLLSDPPQGAAAAQERPGGANSGGGSSGGSGGGGRAMRGKRGQAAAAAAAAAPAAEPAAPAAARPRKWLSWREVRLLRLVAASTCVLNTAGQRDRLPFGGYGYLGACTDSAAALQQALIGRTTLFPLVLGGTAKMGLAALYRAAAGGPAGGGAAWEYAREAGDLAAALGALPCDAFVEPATAAGAAARALACLPERSVFAAAGACRATLQAALRAAEELAGDAPLLD